MRVEQQHEAPPVASVVIVTWNKRDMAVGAVSSVLQQTIARQLEVIVVDNGSTDGTADLLERTFDEQIRVIRSSSNLGFGAGNNLGFRHARGEYLLVLNDDAVVEEGWAEALIAGASDQPNVGMCTSKILCYDDRTRIDNAGHLMYADGLNRSRGHLTRDVGQYDELEETLFASGCAALYRRSAVRDANGFDEDFFAYGDDADLGMKLRLAGYDCWYIPRAVAYHRQSISSGSYSTWKLFRIERNRVWILVKYLPAGHIVLSPLFTLKRLLRSLRAARDGRGLAGKLAQHNSLWQLGGTVAHAWIAACRGVPAMLGKRRRLMHNSKLKPTELAALLERFRATTEEMAFG